MATPPSSSFKVEFENIHKVFENPRHDLNSELKEDNLNSEYGWRLRIHGVISNGDKCMSVSILLQPNVKAFGRPPLQRMPNDPWKSPTAAFMIELIDENEQVYKAMTAKKTFHPDDAKRNIYEFKEFVAMDTLKRYTETLLKNDTLRFRASIHFHVGNHKAYPNPYVWCLDPKAIAVRLEEEQLAIWEPEMKCKILVLNTNDKRRVRFIADKAKLLEKCQGEGSFTQRYGDLMTLNNVIRIKADAEVVWGMITFINYGTIDEDLVTRKETALIRFAEEFLIQGMRKYIENIVSGDLHLENGIDNLELKEKDDSSFKFASGRVIIFYLLLFVTIISGIKYMPDLLKE